MIKKQQQISVSHSHSVVLLVYRCLCSVLVEGQGLWRMDVKQDAGS